MSEIKLAELAKQLLPYLPVSTSADAVAVSGGVTDHGSLTGLDDDDHAHYSLVDGTRWFTGNTGIDTSGANTSFTLKNTNASYKAYLSFTDASVERARVQALGNDLYLHNYISGGAVYAQVHDTVSVKTLLGLVSSSTWRTMTWGDGTEHVDLSLDGGAGKYQVFAMRTAGDYRWTVESNSAAESGSNLGSNFVIASYNDAGVFLRNPLTIFRDTGAFQITHTEWFSINFTGMVSYGYGDLTVGMRIISIPAVVIFGKSGATTDIWRTEDYPGGTESFRISKDMGLEGTTYTKGVTGWQINSTGDAEFNNVRVRGSIYASVFEYGDIQATAGSLVVSKSAAKIYADYTTPAAVESSNTLKAENDLFGTWLFAVDDILRIKHITPSGIIECWLLVTARTDQGDYTDYTVTLKSGNTSTLFVAGSAIADYGISGDGLIYLSADGVIGASANMSIVDHAGSPWTSQTLKARLGNLNNSYGTGANDRYGIGIGDYSSGNYLSYNAEIAGGFVIAAGNGDVTIDSSGIGIEVNSNEGFLSSRAITWQNSTPVTFAFVSGYRIDAEPIYENHLWIAVSSTTGRAASMTLSASAATSEGAFLQIGASASGSSVESKIRMWGGTSGDVQIDALGTGANLGLYATTYISITSLTHTVIDSGTYIELDATTKIEFRENGTLVLNIDGGDVYTNARAAHSPSRVGWASYTFSEVLYKTVGDWVYVQFYISGPSANTSCSFTVPYTSHANGSTLVVLRVQNGGTWIWGYMDLGWSTNVVYLYTSPASGGWSGSGTKTIRGAFMYQRA